MIICHNRTFKYNKQNDIPIAKYADNMSAPYITILLTSNLYLCQTRFQLVLWHKLLRLLPVRHNFMFRTYKQFNYQERPYYVCTNLIRFGVSSHRVITMHLLTSESEAAKTRYIIIQLGCSVASIERLVATS